MRFTQLYFVFFYMFFSCNTEQEKTYPVYSSITESVYASVTIQPDSLYQVFAAVNGILDKNLVVEGDIVQKDQPIIQIINSSPQLNTDNAKLALQLAQQNYKGSAAVLRSIQDEINAAKLQWSNDSVNFFRQKKLWEQKIGSKAVYDSKELAYELSSNRLRLLKNNYERTKNELRTQLMQAENNYKTSKINTTDFTVKSKIAGKVYALYKNEGEIISTSQPIAAIGNANKFIIEMLIDEVDIVKIQKEQQVMVTLDAYPNKLFTARVSKIYPRKDERNQTFLVEALFDESPQVLYPGLSGEANIVIDQRNDVLLIPKQYLIGKNTVRTDNGIVEIETGLQSMDTIEVITGLQKETAIYKPD